jgi:hypothetical protein
VVLWGHDAELTGVVTGSRYDTEVVRVMILRRQDTELTRSVSRPRYDAEVVRVVILWRQDALDLTVCFSFISH